MEQRDLARWHDDGARLEADVCIVGAGATGIALAAELARSRVRVCLLEAGGLERAPRNASNAWTGRCAPFDAIDFRPRSWVPHSGWPFGRRELEPHLERAGELLGLGPQRYDDSLWERLDLPAPSPPLDPAVLRQQVWQYSRRPGRTPEPIRFAEDILSRVRDARNLTLVLHATVTRISTNEHGAQVTGVDARSLDGNRLSVRAPVVVLACGAIENARLLLASSDAGGLGNEHDQVGRYLMDHASPVVASFSARRARALLERFGRYTLDHARGRHVYHLGAALSERAQMSRRLLNCAASLSGEPQVDAAIARFGRTGRVVEPSDLFRVPGELIDAWFRRGMHRASTSRSPNLALVCHPEQLPDPESRVTLSDTRDALGAPTVQIDWRVHELERDTVLSTWDLLRRELARLGLPTPTPAAWVRGEGDWGAAFTHTAHPMGTTRMHDDPRSGVVDAHCRVHGVEGLYASGSSVFTTSGTVDPTLMSVTLAVRLAAHLKAERSQATMPELSTRTRPAASAERVRVGIVGAGERVETVYLPVFAALAARFEVVGLTSRSSERRERVAGAAGVRAFRTPEELCERARPDFVVVCVPASANAIVAMSLVDGGMKLLLETPLAFSMHESRALLKRIAERGVPVGVAEQMPFLPLEELKAALRDAGVFGRVLAAHNDRHSFDHHGIAQLRRYLGRDRRPREASATLASIPLARTEPRVERWTTGSVRYDDGAMLHQQLGAGIAPILARIPGSLRIHGEHASMVGDEVRMGDASARVERHEDKRSRALAALSIALPGIGRITWENPQRDAAFTDEQIGVAAHLDAMHRVARGQGEPLYSAQDARWDIEVLRALELSARMDGAPVSLPINVALEGARLAARPSYWLGRMRR